MNTQTHILLAAALLTRSGRENRRNNAAVLVGAFAPDALIFVMFVWSKLTGVPENEVWRVWYFTPPWLTAIDWMNSIPLFTAIALLGWLLVRHSQSYASVAMMTMLFALAALTHIFGDLPLHVNDGHAHFVPFSQWRFVSPVSYWDPRHYGDIFSKLELALALALIVILWRRFDTRPVRAILALTTLAYAVPYVWFVLLGGHADHNAAATLIHTLPGATGSLTTAHA
jgi:hypothetical protein